ncbi:MAG: exosortase A [Gallionella sp.]|nr:exosortase A [Gallionella sp.]MDD4946941.1 exosortase A [Gallionella sp.]
MSNPSARHACGTLWRDYTALTVAALLALLWLYRDTVISLVTIWEVSPTYAHGYFILPACLYLVWQRRDALKQITPNPVLAGLIMLAALGVGWLVARSAEVQVLEQYLFVAMIPMLVITLLGWQVARALSFPLLFILLAVPFGEVFIRPLIDFTADFTVWALQLTGIPVFREGARLTLPSGVWTVAEACSGLRYLIASFTLGCLYAHLTYRSLHRKLVFIALSVAAPILANGIRAYLIVLLGHFSNMTLAVGVDHLIYGWVFFGVVMFLLFWTGARWREDDQPEALPAAGSTGGSTSPGKTAALALAAVAVLWAAPLYLAHLEQRAYNPTPVTLTLPDTLGGWQVVSPEIGLTPSFPGAAATLMREYRRGDQSVGIYLAYFRNQHREGKAVSSMNILAEEKAPKWNVVDESLRALAIPPGSVRQDELLWGDRQMLAWQWYWIGGDETASPYRAKWLQVRQHLTGHGDDAADIVIFAPHELRPEQIAAVLAEFLTQAGPAIRQSLKHASGK